MNIESESLITAPDAVCSVRGRPVAYFRSKWGGELRALERGYFPVSNTGYRSLGCGPGAVEPSQEILNKLALENERENTATLVSCSRALGRLHGDSLSRYIHISLHANSAAERGFFAPDDVRLALWQHAYRLFSAIAENPAMQPRPLQPAGAWNEAHCARAIVSVRKVVPWLARLIAGELSEFPASHEETGLNFFSARAYLELPPRPTPEPVGTVPAIVQDFAFACGLALDRHQDDAQEDEPVAVDYEPSPTPDSAGLVTPQMAQLELF